MCIDLRVCVALCVFVDVCMCTWVGECLRLCACVFEVNEMFQILAHCLYVFLSEFINLYPFIFLYILLISGLIDAVYRCQEQLILDLISAICMFAFSLRESFGILKSGVFTFLK